MGPDRDRTRDPWNCSQTRICCQTRYRLRYAARSMYFVDNIIFVHRPSTRNRLLLYAVLIYPIRSLHDSKSLYIMRAMICLLQIVPAQEIVLPIAYKPKISPQLPIVDRSMTTVNPVLSGYSKIDKTKALKTICSLMEVESIAECSL